MNPILRNILAVVAGILVGGFVNGLVVTYGATLYPPPQGVDPNDLESIKANLHLYSNAQLLVPLWAHAAGTFVGAFITALIAVNKRLGLALIIGAFFLLGGIAMVVMVGGPVWFIVLDLLVAYLPMAFIGGMAAIALKKS